MTAIVRDRSKITNPALKVLERDLFALTAEDLKGFDAVVDAFGTAFDPESAKAHQTSMKHLISVMEQLPEVRRTLTPTGPGRGSTAWAGTS